MTAAARRSVRCAIYTRVSTESGLEQDFNSLDAQYDAAHAYIRSQAHAGWTLVRTRYDDGGFSGGSTDRPALQQLLDDIRARRINVIVAYKVDRLTRSLADFAKLVELFDAHGVSFVSVTQQFNTTTSIGRLTLNVLLSFAQFEREVTSERIRAAPGTEFLRPETKPKFRVVLPVRDQISKTVRRKGRANAAFSHKVSVIRDSADCVVAHPVSCEPVSLCRFPANREINREFC